MGHQQTTQDKLEKTPTKSAMTITSEKTWTDEEFMALPGN